MVRPKTGPYHIGTIPYIMEMARPWAVRFCSFFAVYGHLKSNNSLRIGMWTNEYITIFSYTYPLYTICIMPPAALQRHPTSVFSSIISLFSGFSDPYCMLGIQPGHDSPISPQPSRDTPPLSPRLPACRALSDSGSSDLDSPKHESHHEKLRKHHRYTVVPSC